jgi:hypothetical protein
MGLEEYVGIVDGLLRSRSQQGYSLVAIESFEKKVGLPFKQDTWISDMAEHGLTSKIDEKTRFGTKLAALIVFQKLCSLVLIGPLSEELDTELTSALWSFIRCMNHIAKSMTKGQRGKVLENDDWNDAAHELRKSLRQHGRKMYVTGVIYRAEMTKKKGELRFDFRPMKANARGEWLLELWERDRLRKQNSF